MTCSPCCYVCAFLCAGVCCVLQRCVAAAKATFKAIAVSEPRIRGAAKAALRDALQQRFDLVREAVLARAAAKVDQQLLKAAQQISTVRQDPAWFLAHVYPSLFPVVQPCSGRLHCASSAISRHAGMLTLSHPASGELCIFRICNCLAWVGGCPPSYLPGWLLCLHYLSGCCTCAMQAARLHSRWVDVQAEVSRTVAEYDAQTSGPTKWLGLTACLQQQYGQMVADFVQRCEAEADKKVGARGTGWGVAREPGGGGGGVLHATAGFIALAAWVIPGVFGMCS